MSYLHGGQTKIHHIKRALRPIAESRKHSDNDKIVAAAYGTWHRICRDIMQC